MRKRNRKVAKYRRPIHINAGMIIFVIIFIYIAINVWNYFNQQQLSIYEVTEKNIADNNKVTGIAIRDETVIMAQKTGFVNYYRRDGERIAKNSLVYTVDETGNAAKEASSGDSEMSLKKSDIKNIQSDISEFRKNYSNSNYKEVYSFKYNIENTIFELSNQSSLDNMDALAGGDGKNTVNAVKAEKSGIITYSIDSMEGLKVDDVTADMINNTEEYSRTPLRVNTQIGIDSPVYKVVTNENWSVVVSLTEEQYDLLKDKQAVTITFLKDNFSTDVMFEAYKKGEDYLARLDFKRFMLRYINERYLQLEISTNSANGLKIPVTSVDVKEFYKIPVEFFTVGGDSGRKGIALETEVEGISSYNFVATDIFYEDEEYGYIDTSLVEKGDTIRSADSNETYVIKDTEEFQGAYNVNNGYAIFKRVEIIYENKEYFIVKKGSYNGLNVYDHIVLDGKVL